MRERVHPGVEHVLAKRLLNLVSLLGHLLRRREQERALLDPLQRDLGSFHFGGIVRPRFCKLTKRGRLRRDPPLEVPPKLRQRGDHVILNETVIAWLPEQPELAPTDPHHHRSPRRASHKHFSLHLHPNIGRDTLIPLVPRVLVSGLELPRRERVITHPIERSMQKRVLF